MEKRGRGGERLWRREAVEERGRGGKRPWRREAVKERGRGGERPPQKKGNAAGLTTGKGFETGRTIT